MSIATELTRMAGNVGALAADTSAIFEALRAKGVSVPADAQLSDVADMIEEIENPPSTVNIGGREYPVVKIGNQLWMVEELALSAGTYKTRSGYDCYYYQMPDDTSWITPYLHDGWRLPTKEDADILKEYVELTYSEPLNALKSPDWGGTNESGWNARDLGYYYYIASDPDNGWLTNRHFTRTTTDASYTNVARKFDIKVQSESYNFDDESAWSHYMPIRLVRTIS